MDTVAILCNNCVPYAGMEDFTVGFLSNPTCNRCGCECEPGNRNVGKLKHLWPRAIPVSEGYPPAGTVVMAFANGWHDYESTGKGFCFLPCDERPDARLPEITHWLPKPPDPRK